MLPQRHRQKSARVLVGLLETFANDCGGIKLVRILALEVAVRHNRRRDVLEIRLTRLKDPILRACSGDSFVVTERPDHVDHQVPRNAAGVHLAGEPLAALLREECKAQSQLRPGLRNLVVRFDGVLHRLKLWLGRRVWLAPVPLRQR
eukprot:973179-Pleurochrysis_carterae.AAC.2